MNYLKYKTNLKDWEEFERERVLNLFLEHEYGVRPEECNKELTYNEIDRKVYDNLIIKRMGMYYEDYEMIFYVCLPNKEVSNLKTFVQIIYPYAEEDIDFYSDYQTLKNYTPIDKIVDRNYAVILLSCKTIASDVMGGEKTGIFNKMKSERTFNSWGVLSSWSWGASKVIDYLVNNKEFDKDNIAVIGHSRGGKTALLTGAIDKRVKYVISNESGNSGASLSRGNIGESIEDITNRFPYWFCENYKKYQNKESDLPFDQHMLIGLIAPRNVYIASASLDDWADPENELRSARLASYFYELYGIKGLIVPNKIENNISYNEGNIAYHSREGEHDLTPFDWEMYMDYFDKIK